MGRKRNHVPYSATPREIMKLAHLERMFNFFFLLFYLAVNKLITDKTQNIFSLTAEHSAFIKHILNKVNFLAVNKLITNKMQNIFSLTAEHSAFIKHFLNKVNFFSSKQTDNK